MKKKLYIDKYWVYENGDVVNLKTNYKLTPFIASKGYVAYVIMNQEKKRQTIYIHRILAKLFIPNPNHYKYIIHLNGIKTDNRLENLKWTKTYFQYDQINSIEDKYQINSDGTVYNKLTNKFISLSSARNGYLVVSFNINGTPKLANVHQLVAKKYLPKTKLSGSHVIHKDGNKLNNDVSNLEWNIPNKYELKYPKNMYLFKGQEFTLSEVIKELEKQGIITKIVD